MSESVLSKHVTFLEKIVVWQGYATIFLEYFF